MHTDPLEQPSAEHASVYKKKQELMTNCNYTRGIVHHITYIIATFVKERKVV